MNLILWCALSIDPLYYVANPAQRPVVMMVIENRSKQAVDFTKLKTSMQLDGKPMPNWSAIMASAAEPAWKNVPPGKYLQLGINLSEQLKSPGAHTLKLTGDCQSNEARVLTKGQK